MTIEQAIKTEQSRYLAACSMASNLGRERATDSITFEFVATERAYWLRQAHINLLALKRLQHYVVTEHEELKHLAHV